MLIRDNCSRIDDVSLSFTLVIDEDDGSENVFNTSRIFVSL